MTFAIFAVLTLATYRVTRLILVDTIFEGARMAFLDRVAQRFAPTRRGALARFVYDLFQCQWCVGVHVAFWSVLVTVAVGIVPFTWSVADVVSFWGWVLALAAASSILWVAVEDRLTPE